jgi:cell division protein FtsI (penicillin-binding protein 3)
VLVLCLLVAAGLTFWLFQERLGLFAKIRGKISSLTALVDETAPPRGTIFDRNLKQLAVTLDRVSVYARTQEITSVAQTVQVLGAILSLDEKELQHNLESTTLRVWVAENISLEQEIAVKSKRLPGIYLQREEKRFYPNGPLAAHVLGYAENGIGLAGVEHYYDKVLAGGKRAAEDDDQRFSSLDLVLTLDLKLQEILDAILAETFQRGAVTSALACMIDGKSGEVVASSQLPSFDPNTFAKFSKEVMANRLAMAIPLPTRFRTLLRDVALLHNDGKEEGVRLPWSVRALDGDAGSKLRLWERFRLSDNPLTDFHAISQPGEGVEAAVRTALTQDPSLAMVPESATPLNILAAWATMLNEGKAVWPHVITKSSPAAGEKNSPEKNDGRGRQVVMEPPLPAEVSELFRSMARIGNGSAAFFHDELPVIKTVGTSSQIQLLEMVLVTIPAGESDLNLLLLVERNPPGPTAKNGKKVSLLEQLVEEKVERLSILQQVATTVADVVEPEVGEDVNYQGDISDQGETRRDEGERTKTRPRLTIMPDLRGQSLRQGLRLLQGGQLRLAIHGTGKIVSHKPGAGTPLTGVKEVVLILEKDEEVTPEILAKRAAAGK